MKIIVTGADGFVGQHLVELLKKSNPPAGGDKVFGLDRNQADITNYGSVKKYLEKIKPDQVYHLAGFASGAGKDKKLIFDVNVNGTINVLKALKEIGKPVKVLLASTAYVYGNTPKCASENSKTDAKSFYDKSKLKMEKEVIKYANQDIQIVITRASNHTGPGQKLGFVVSDFCSQIVEANPPAGGGEIIEVGNLDAERDLFDVRDVVRAYKIVMEKGKSGEIYNIGTGKTVSVKDILNELIKISGKKISYKIDKSKMRKSDISKNCVNPSKISKLDWKPKISLDKTLKDTYKHYLTIDKM